MNLRAQRAAAEAAPLVRGRGTGDKAERPAVACRPERVFAFHSKCNGKPLGGF